LLENLAAESEQSNAILSIAENLASIGEPIRKDIALAINQALKLTYGTQSNSRTELVNFKQSYLNSNFERYSSNLYSSSALGIQHIPEIKAQYSESSKLVDGREILVAYFDHLLGNDPRVFAFGEDLGKIGDVNQGFAGLQDKYGESRVSDTGIRELTIIGQGLGAALRGLRPIAEIQYLDYLLYGLQPLSDDLATLQYRTKGGQKAPLIVRTRGHRLEGIWHSGSPIGMIINAIRGMYVCVPRNMTQAAGMYNTLMQSDEPALVIECLNGYRLKEMLPDNMGKYAVPLGKIEVLQEGSDMSIVSYGSTLRIVQDAAKQLEEIGISCEIIDAQTLIPFDIHHQIAVSVQKTNKLLIVDEDVPGGASAYILQQLIEKQDIWKHLDAKPHTLTAKEHRPAYGTDGDYYSKPSIEDVFEKVLSMMNEYNPEAFAAFI
jgi:pyruvate/2-oxoglutarate/acetoin dehydrogenase E1 component